MDMYIYSVNKNPIPLSAYQRNAPKFLKTGKGLLNQFEGDFFWLKKFLYKGGLEGR